jgi:hypothetical protein
MRDICQGMDTAYGSTQMDIACRIPDLAPNGAYLIFTDMVMQTDSLVDASSLTSAYFNTYQVVSLTHSKIS